MGRVGVARCCLLCTTTIVNLLRPLLPSPACARPHRPSPTLSGCIAPFHTLSLPRTSSCSYDDYGGFFDHVTPPAAPQDESPCNVWNAHHGLPPTAPTRCPYPFDFTLLGKRAASMLISPWIAKVRSPVCMPIKCQLHLT